MVYLLRARLVESKKHPLLGVGYVMGNNGIIVESGVFCEVRTEVK
jgi:hypothetical protein